MPLPGLTDEELAKHAAGDALFEAKYVTPPAPVHAGLGPLYNSNACAGCHLKDGRGVPTFEGVQGSQMLVMVSAASGAGVDPGGPAPVDGIGLQIQDRAVAGATCPDY